MFSAPPKDGDLAAVERRDKFNSRKASVVQMGQLFSFHVQLHKNAELTVSNVHHCHSCMCDVFALIARGSLPTSNFAECCAVVCVLLWETKAFILAWLKGLRAGLVSQGVSKKEVVERLQNPALVEAVYGMVLQYASSVTALRNATRADVKRALAGTAAALRFVGECHTRLRLKAGGADVTRADVASRVNRHPHPAPYYPSFNALRHYV